MVKDPQFVASAKTRKILIDPASAEEVEAVTRDTMKLPKETMADLRKLMQN